MPLVGCGSATTPIVGEKSGGTIIASAAQTDPPTRAELGARLGEPVAGFALNDGAFVIANVVHEFAAQSNCCPFNTRLFERSDGAITQVVRDQSAGDVGKILEIQEPVGLDEHSATVLIRLANGSTSVIVSGAATKTEAGAIARRTAEDPGTVPPPDFVRVPDGPERSAHSRLTVEFRSGEESVTLRDLVVGDGQRVERLVPGQMSWVVTGRGRRLLINTATSDGSVIASWVESGHLVSLAGRLNREYLISLVSRVIPENSAAWSQTLAGYTTLRMTQKIESAVSIDSAIFELHSDGTDAGAICRTTSEGSMCDSPASSEPFVTTFPQKDGSWDIAAFTTQSEMSVSVNGGVQKPKCEAERCWFIMHIEPDVTSVHLVASQQSAGMTNLLLDSVVDSPTE